MIFDYIDFNYMKNGITDEISSSSIAFSKFEKNFTQIVEMQKQKFAHTKIYLKFNTKNSTNIHGSVSRIISVASNVI